MPRSELKIPDSARKLLQKICQERRPLKFGISVGKASHSIAKGYKRSRHEVSQQSRGVTRSWPQREEKSIMKHISIFANFMVDTLSKLHCELGTGTELTNL